MHFNKWNDPTSKGLRACANQRWEPQARVLAKWKRLNDEAKQHEGAQHEGAGAKKPPPAQQQAQRQQAQAQRQQAQRAQAQAQPQQQRSSAAQLPEGLLGGLGAGSQPKAQPKAQQQALKQEPKQEPASAHPPQPTPPQQQQQQQGTAVAAPAAAAAAEDADAGQMLAFESTGGRLAPFCEPRCAPRSLGACWEPMLEHRACRAGALHADAAGLLPPLSSAGRLCLLPASPSPPPPRPPSRPHPQATGGATPPFPSSSTRCAAS